MEELAFTPSTLLLDLPVECLEIILKIRLVDCPAPSHEPESPRRMQWMTLRHTCRSFFYILSALPNPFQHFLARFDGREQHAEVSTWDGSLDISRTWARRVDCLLSVSAFTVHIVLSMVHCKAVAAARVASVFQALVTERIADALVSFELRSSSPFLHTIPLPPFPNLTRIRLALNWHPSAGRGNFYSCAVSDREIETQLVFRAPKLCRLYVDTNNMCPVRIEKPTQLTKLSLDFTRVCKAHTPEMNIYKAISNDNVLLPDFPALSKQLTRLCLHIRMSWLRDLSLLEFPVLQVLLLHVVGHGTPTEIRTSLLAPRLQTAIFRLSDLRCISFDACTFHPTLKRLVIGTPCVSGYPTRSSAFISASMVPPSSVYWADHSFLVHYPVLEDAIFAIHGLEPIPPGRPRVSWPAVKRLMIFPEPGITEYLSLIDFPLLEEICLVYPEWCVKSGWPKASEERGKIRPLGQTNHVEANGIVENGAREHIAGDEGNDEDGGDDDAMEDYDENSSHTDSEDSDDDVIVSGRHVLQCYHTIRNEIKHKFPQIRVTRLNSSKMPDTFFFDFLPPHTHF